MKNRTEAPAEKLIMNKVSEKALIYLIVDFITKLPLVAEKNAILVVCNQLSKIAHFMVITEGTSAEGLVRQFQDNVWKLHKLLKSVISNRESQFAVELIKKLNKILGIETRLLTVFHSQTDRQIEWINQELE